jgi:hypothetical protein
VPPHLLGAIAPRTSDTLASRSASSSSPPPSSSFFSLAQELSEWNKWSVEHPEGLNKWLQILQLHQRWDMFSPKVAVLNQCAYSIAVINQCTWDMAPIPTKFAP